MTDLRGMAAVGSARISQDDEASNSINRQLDILRRDEQEQGYRLIEIAEDLSISGAVDPMKRRNTKHLFQPPLVDKWELLVFSHFDRSSRQDVGWQRFVLWMLDNGKRLRLINDLDVDITTEEGRLFGSFKAYASSMYRKTISEKSSAQKRYYREIDLWPGGSTPYGYKSEQFQHEGKIRYRLTIDPITSELVREAYDKLVNKRVSKGRLIREWNARGIPTSKDHQRTQRGLPAKGYKWYATTIREVFANPALMGYAKHKGEVRYRDGLPVRWAEPILTEDEFKELQERLRELNTPKVRHSERNPLKDIVHCRCGSKMYLNTADYKNRGVVYQYIVCNASKNGLCQYTKRFRLEHMQSRVESVVLSILGDQEIATVVTVPGQDHREEIDRLTRAIRILGEDADIEENATLRRELRDKQRGYAERLDILQQYPVTEDTEHIRWTGETYRQRWEQMTSWHERGSFLSGHGIGFKVWWEDGEPHMTVSYPKDLARRIGTSRVNDPREGDLI